MVDLSRVRQSGPLAPFAAGFAATLAADGYTPHGAVKQLHLFASLSRWLEREGLDPGQLDEEMLGRFFDERRAVGHTKLLSVRAAERLLAYLRELGVVAPRCAPRCEGPVEELLAAYQRYLVLERGLLAESARGYAVKARPFLEGLSDPDGIRFDRIDGAAVVVFVVASCPSQSRSSAKRTTKALRSLSRFLHAEGLIQWPLDHAVPAASGWRLAGLPKCLEPEQIARLFGSCDRSTPVGGVTSRSWSRWRV
jgi:integrase/recombinase XerD